MRPRRSIYQHPAAAALGRVALLLLVSQQVLVGAGEDTTTGAWPGAKYFKKWRKSSQKLQASPAVRNAAAGVNLGLLAEGYLFYVASYHWLFKLCVGLHSCLRHPTVLSSPSQGAKSARHKVRA